MSADKKFPPPPTADKLYFSFWSWQLLKDCPKSFYLNVIQRVERPPMLDKGNAIQGSIPHAQSEDFFRLPLEKRDLNFFQNTFEQYWQKFLKENHVEWAVHGYKIMKEANKAGPLPKIEDLDQQKLYDLGYKEKRQETKECSDNLARLVGSLGLHRLSAITEAPFRVVVEPEKRFSDGSIIPELAIGGRIDLVFLMDDGTEEIWDVKGVKSPSNLDTDQLIFYRMGRQAQGKTVRRVGYLLLKQCRPEAKRVTDAMEVQLKKLLRTSATYFKHGNWPANYRAWRCGWCDVRHACDVYQQREARDIELNQLTPGTKVEF